MSAKTSKLPEKGTAGGDGPSVMELLMTVLANILNVCTKVFNFLMELYYSSKGAPKPSVREDYDGSDAKQLMSESDMPIFSVQGSASKTPRTVHDLPDQDYFKKPAVLPKVHEPLSKKED